MGSYIRVQGKNAPGPDRETQWLKPAATIERGL